MFYITNVGEHNKSIFFFTISKMLQKYLYGSLVKKYELCLFLHSYQIQYRQFICCFDNISSQIFCIPNLKIHTSGLVDYLKCITVCYNEWYQVRNITNKKMLEKLETKLIWQEWKSIAQNFGLVQLRKLG